MKLNCPPNLDLDETRAIHILLEILIDALTGLLLEVSQAYPTDPEPYDWGTWEEFEEHLNAKRKL